MSCHYVRGRFCGLWYTKSIQCEVQKDFLLQSFLFHAFSCLVSWFVCFHAYIFGFYTMKFVLWRRWHLLHPGQSHPQVIVQEWAGVEASWKYSNGVRENETTKWSEIILSVEIATKSERVMPSRFTAMEYICFCFMPTFRGRKHFDSYLHHQALLQAFPSFYPLSY